MKFAAVSAVVLLGASAIVGVAGSSVSAAPTPTVCVSHSTDVSLFPTATLRIMVRECSPVSDAMTIVSVCKTETLFKANGAYAVVEDTCNS